jgi:thiol-disulfide isomerase/thioredoxin
MSVEIDTLSKYNIINNIDFGDKVIFFKFGAEWCVPCKELEKILIEIPGVLIYNINIDNEDFESFFEDNNICNIPDTMVKYKDRSDRFVGRKTPEEINSIIEKIKQDA